MGNEAGSGAFGDPISRGEFVKRAGVGVAGVALSGTAASSAFGAVQVNEAADAARTIKIGFISPRSGPLAGFGEPTPYLLAKARKAFAKGLVVGGKRYAVQIIDKDTTSDPVRAGQIARELINKNKVDIILTTSTPETNNPVSDAAEAAGVPAISTVEPWEAWFFGRKGDPKKGFKSVFHFSFGTGDFAKTYLSQWSLIKTNKKVGVMWPNDADGNAIRSSLGPLLEKGGYTIVDPGAYQDGTQDFSSQIAKFKQEGVEIFNTFPIPPDFATFWRQAAQQGLTRQIKIAQIAKAGLFPSEIVALGSIGYLLATGAYWHPVFPYRWHLTGQSGKQLADDYEKKTGKPWNQNLGSDSALFDVAVAAFRKAGNPKNKKAVANAMRNLRVDTPLGHLDWAKGPVPNVVTTPIPGCQWVKSNDKFKVDLLMTEHAGDKRVPIQAKLKPYNS
jgi:branched-chain amino acid transport system substrate-binding protein